MTRHLLTGTELDRDELHALLDRADALKAAPLSSRALEGRSVALIFEKPSTRTRLSFEAGVFELGGQPIVLRRDELQLARGESVGDTARILSRHVAAIGVRTGPDALLEELAAGRDVPVFNMLTAGHHPCQALADLMTLREEFGRARGPEGRLRRRRQQRRALARARRRDRGRRGRGRLAGGLHARPARRTRC